MTHAGIQAIAADFSNDPRVQELFETIALENEACTACGLECGGECEAMTVTDMEGGR